MLRLILIFLSIIFSFSHTVSVMAAEGDNRTPQTVKELSVLTVSVLDEKNIQVVFSENIDLSSIVLKITKQIDSSTVEIADLSKVPDFPDTVQVVLKDLLEEGTSYTLTVLAAVGVSGSTIIDGAGALREFVTPSPLKKAEVAMNAPANPNAILAEEKPEPIQEGPTENTPSQPDPVPTQELPLTGMNPLLLLLIALPISYWFIRKRAI